MLVALWLVFVPVSALFYNAFTEDTGFGPGAFSLQNFVDAYSSWQILALFRNSLVFALGTALTTFVLGGPGLLGGRAHRRARRPRCSTAWRCCPSRSRAC